MRDFDQQPITIHSKLDFDTYKRNCHFMVFMNYPFNNWVCFIGLPLLALLYWLLLPATEFSLRPFAIAFLFFWLLGSLILLFKAWVYPRRNYKYSPETFQTSMSYQFRNHQVVVSYSGNLARGQGVFSYQTIYLVFERPDVFYIYIGPTLGYLIKKSDFDTDTPESLRQLLQSALPAKKYGIYD